MKNVATSSILLPATELEVKMKGILHAKAQAIRDTVGRVINALDYALDVDQLMVEKSKSFVVGVVIVVVVVVVFLFL